MLEASFWVDASGTVGAVDCISANVDAEGRSIGCWKGNRQGRKMRV